MIMRWSWPLDAWKILINLIRSWSPWSRRILDLLIFKNKSSLNRNWILFILHLKRKLAIAWKGNCFTLICFFCFKPLSSPTRLNLLWLSFPLEKQEKILTIAFTWMNACCIALYKYHSPFPTYFFYCCFFSSLLVGVSLFDVSNVEMGTLDVL